MFVGALDAEGVVGLEGVNVASGVGVLLAEFTGKQLVNALNSITKASPLRINCENFILSTLILKMGDYRIIKYIPIRNRQNSGRISLYNPFKGTAESHCINGNAHNFLTASEQGNWFGTGQGVQELACGTVSTMYHQVYFHKTRFVFVPVRKGTHRDALFQQATGLGGAQTMRFDEAGRR
jgi:hypothetical protein